MNSQSYLERLSYSGPTDPTAITLRNLHLAHLQSVPFENLDIHLGRPIVLDQETLYEKIVTYRRGGFCYEQNGLFAWLLRELGFEVTLLSACVANDEGVFGQEFDHLTLRVVCPTDPDQPALPWLADVGFGDSFRQPLRLDRFDEQQPQWNRSYRIDEKDGYLILQQRESDRTWQRQYRFAMQPRRLEDFGEMCLYHQTSPASSFTQQRVCTLATENGRITLSDLRFIETIEGKRQERVVDQAEYHAILAEQFGILLP